jgi:hypothetical protein
MKDYKDRVYFKEELKPKFSGKDAIVWALFALASCTMGWLIVVVACMGNS